MPYNAGYAALYLKTVGKRLGVSRIDFYGNRRYTGINGILTTEYEASDVYIFPSVTDIFVHYQRLFGLFLDGWFYGNNRKDRYK